MEIKQPSLFSRGKLMLGAAPHVNPDSLLQEIGQAWASRGFSVYKTALIGMDVVLKKSGWTGVGLKIKQNNGMVDILYNAFAPSAMVRVLAMGLIPILIVNSSSWQPMLRSFEQYVQSSPYFAHGQLGAGQAMLPQATANYPHGQPQQPPQQYPCQACGTSLQWVAEHQRWFCARCQQYR
jgi:hypothetical protein